MEVEKKRSGPVTKKTMKPRRVQLMQQFNKKKVNRRKKLRQQNKKRKEFLDLVEDGTNKDWRVLLREKLETICQESGHSLAFSLARLFKEENRSLMGRVVEQLGDEPTRTLARQAVNNFITGGVSRTDGQGERTMGGIFFKIIKEVLREEDPLRAKAIFIKSEDAKKRKHQIRKQRKAEKQNSALGAKMVSSTTQSNKANPFANVFNSLV